MVRASWLFVGVLACSGRAGETSEPVKSEPGEVGPASSQPAAPAASEPTEPLRVAKIADGDGLAGKLRIDAEAKPLAKGFQGVWLDRAEGEPYVLAYRPVPWLKPLAGRAVRVTGATYEPPGQAIMATHYRVDTLWVVGDESEVPVIGFGPETTLAGKFVRAQVEARAKDAGESLWTFVTTGGARYLVEHAPEGLVDGAPVQVQARAIAPSPTHAARRGGDWLWVLDATPQAASR